MTKKKYQIITKKIIAIIERDSPMKKQLFKQQNIYLMQPEIMLGCISACYNAFGLLGVKLLPALAFSLQKGRGGDVMCQ